MTYKRILLKISGEALMGQKSHGIDADTLLSICEGVKTAHDSGVEIVIVVGGGNIFRGIQGAQMGIDEATAHHMGMLATVMNGLALRDCFASLGVKASTLSALPLESLCLPYARWRALDLLCQNEIVICVAGTGNPYFTTDTGAVLRAIELECQATLKATQVDGVYDRDPKKYADAKRYETINYSQILQDNLKVMDSTAIALAQDNHMPLVVFSLSDPTQIYDITQGKGIFTHVQ